MDNIVGVSVKLPGFKTILASIGTIGITALVVLTFMVLLSVYGNLNSNSIEVNTVEYDMRPVTIGGAPTNIMCVAAYNSVGLDLSCFIVPIGDGDLPQDRGQ